MDLDSKPPKTFIDILTLRLRREQMRCPITIAFLLATDGNITLVVVVVSFSREINNIAYAVKGACSVYAVQLCTSSRSAEREAIEFVNISPFLSFYFFSRHSLPLYT